MYASSRENTGNTFVLTPYNSVIVTFPGEKTVGNTCISAIQFWNYYISGREKLESWKHLYLLNTVMELFYFQSRKHWIDGNTCISTWQSWNCYISSRENTCISWNSCGIVTFLGVKTLVLVPYNYCYISGWENTVFFAEQWAYSTRLV